MYIPPLNLMANKEEQLEFMKNFSFAAIITVVDGVPVATHLPFLVLEHGDKVILKLTSQRSTISGNIFHRAKTW